MEGGKVVSYCLTLAWVRYCTSFIIYRPVIKRPRRVSWLYNHIIFMNYTCTHCSHDSRKGLFSIRLFRAYHLNVTYLEKPGSLQESKFNKDGTKLSKKTPLTHKLLTYYVDWSGDQTEVSHSAQGFLSDARQPEVDLLHSWALCFCQNFWANCLYKGKQMWRRQGILNDKRPYFRLKCVAQKRLCLSALLTVDEDRQMYPRVRGPFL